MAAERTDEDPELVALFRVELTEMLDGLTATLEGVSSDDGEERTRSVHGAFRLVHNLKGAARIAGFDAIVELAHAIEDELSRFRERGSPPSPEALAELLDAIPALERLGSGSLDEAESRALVARTAVRFGEVRREGAAPEHPIAAGGTPLAAGAREPDADEEREPDADGAREPEEIARASPAIADAFVRVAVKRLDQLMASVGDLLPVQSQLAARDAELGALADELSWLVRGSPSELAGHIDDIARRLDQLARKGRATGHAFEKHAGAVVDAARRVRMLPLKQLSQHWHRVLREAAATARRPVRLEIDVGEIELDKRVLDGLKEPLLHLLRNAVDHGIEPPAERRARGKPEHGRVTIGARMMGTLVAIEVSDDGRGIDLSRVRARAVHTGMVTQEQAMAMPSAELFALLFRPGFSTAPSVSPLSGRGVGLDVVHGAVRGLGGSVQVVSPSVLGGATFQVLVPVTVALIRGLLVRAGSASQIVPIEPIVRAQRVEAGDIRKIGGKSMLSARDEEPIPVRWLAPAAPLERAPSRAHLMMLLLAHGDGRIGLFVDEILGEHQFITMPLAWNIKGVPGVSAVVLLPDGKLAPVVDVLYFFERERAAESHVSAPEGTFDRPASRPRILVVDDSLSARVLVRNILQAADYGVVLKVDGQEAWEALQAEEFALVVSDVSMPRMDGLELTRRVRADPRLRNLPVILTTSLDRKEEIAAGAAAGASEYIIKGELDQRRLLEAVARLV